MRKAKNEKTERVTTSVKVNPEFWKRVKIYCLTHDIEVSKFLEKALKASMKDTK